MFRRWRRQRAVRKARPGDGSPLRPYRPWQLLWRSLFTMEHAGTADEAHEYVVDVNLFDLDGKAELYRDGVQQAVAEMPAAFPVPGGVIEVASSVFGMKRVHLVLDSGAERQLRPARGTAEYWRARLGQRHPRLSRWLAGTAVVVLLVGLVVVVPQLVERVSHIPVVADRLGTFTSPVSIPPWLNSVVVVAGVLAALERALTVRNHWLIDADTWLLGD